MVCPPVRLTIHSLVDCLPVQVDKPWYNYYIKQVHKANTKQAKMHDAELNDLRRLICLRQSEVSIKRFSACNVIDVI